CPWRDAGDDRTGERDHLHDRPYGLRQHVITENAFDETVSAGIGLFVDARACCAGVLRRHPRLVWADRSRPGVVAAPAQPHAAPPGSDLVAGLRHRSGCDLRRPDAERAALLLPDGGSGGAWASTASRVSRMSAERWLPVHALPVSTTPAGHRGSSC